MSMRGTGRYTLVPGRVVSPLRRSMPCPCVVSLSQLCSLVDRGGALTYAGVLFLFVFGAVAQVRLPNGDSIPVVLLANKCDTLQWEWTAEALDRICEREVLSTVVLAW